jgi:tetrahydromethanopterin S-methyltransferase subunit F
LKVIEKINFLNVPDISNINQYISNINYKLCFLEHHFFWLGI